MLYEFFVWCGFVLLQYPCLFDSELTIHTVLQVILDLKNRTVQTQHLDS